MNRLLGLLEVLHVLAVFFLLFSRCLALIAIVLDQKYQPALFKQRRERF